MRLLESGEDYLEAIWTLKKEKHLVRSVDVAKFLSVSKPSVSVAMKALRENGYIAMTEEGFITLTTKGLEISLKVRERHDTLTRFFVALGVTPKTASEDACKIEHDISEESYSKLKEHLEKL